MNALPVDAQIPPPGSPAPDAALQHPMLFVQSLKGAPASVLLALAVAGRFMTHQELQLWTRCGHVQVKMALRQLQLLGWVRARSRRGPWAVAGGFGVTLPALFFAGNAFKALNDDDDSLNPLEGGTTSSIARREQLRTVMQQQGIEEPTASELIDLPYVTEEYILSHVQAARAKGLNLGAAIERMRLGGPAPAVPVTRSREDDQAEKVRRFMEGR
jgi:hypothetical protein